MVIKKTVTSSSLKMAINIVLGFKVSINWQLNQCNMFCEEIKKRMGNGNLGVTNSVVCSFQTPTSKVNYKTQTVLCTSRQLPNRV